MWISCVWPGIQRLSWFGWWGNGVSNLLGSNNLNHTKWWPNGSFRISTYVFDLLVFCLSHTASLAICSLWKGSQKAPLLLVQLHWPPHNDSHPHRLLSLPCSESTSSSHSLLGLILGLSSQLRLKALSSGSFLGHEISSTWPSSLPVLVSSWVDVLYVSSGGAGTLSVIFLDPLPHLSDAVRPDAPQQLLIHNKKHVWFSCSSPISRSVVSLTNWLKTNSMDGSGYSSTQGHFSLELSPFPLLQTEFYHLTFRNTCSQELYLCVHPRRI